MSNAVLIVHQNKRTDLPRLLEDLRKTVNDDERFQVKAMPWSAIHTHRKGFREKGYSLAVQAQADGYRGLVLVVDPIEPAFSEVKAAVEKVRSENLIDLVLGYSGQTVESWPAEEVDRLRTLFESLPKRPPVRSRDVEQGFWRQLGDARRRYAGQWVVLEGNAVIASGSDAVDVTRRARKKGVDVPYVFFVATDMFDQSIQTLGG